MLYDDLCTENENLRWQQDFNSQFAIVSPSCLPMAYHLNDY